MDSQYSSPPASLRCWLALSRAKVPTEWLDCILSGRWSLPRLFSMNGREYEKAGIPRRLHTLLRVQNEAQWRRDLAWVEAAPDHHAVTWQDIDYPSLLREIPDPPPLLFARGQRQHLQRLQFAVVGSRNPDAYGERLATNFATNLVEQGWTVTSGLALGVDHRAHCAALKAGGSTVAVLGNGLASVYPKRHRSTAEHIVKQGILLSELAPEAQPLPGHFPRRNRIISGMSRGVLLIEATIRSGSLITARHALDQGREVFAVPGSVHNALSRGCHQLIKQGAKLVECMEDIMEELPAWAVPEPHNAGPVSDADPTGQRDVDPAKYRELLQRMGYEPVSLDALAETTGWTSEQLAPALLALELDGHVAIETDGRYVRVA